MLYCVSAERTIAFTILSDEKFNNSSHGVTEAAKELATL